MPAEAVEAVTTGDVAKDAQNLMADEFFYRGSQHAVTRAKPQSDRRPPDAGDVAKFMAWLAAHGADTSRLRWPVMQGGDRKAFARVDVAADAAALRVPEALMMSPSKALASEIGAACDRHGLRGDVLLATFIVFELRKGEKSFWAPYLGMLETPATCCDWASEDLDALHDPELRERTESRERWILDLYERYFTKTLCMRHPDLFPVDCFTYERFRFAWFVVQSRAFGRKLRETSLVPLADCLNHSATVACSYRLVKGCFELFPTQDGQCVRGRELLNSYGPCPNSKLLLDYGFALLDNPHDTVRLALQLRPKRALRARPFFFNDAPSTRPRSSDDDPTLGSSWARGTTVKFYIAVQCTAIRLYSPTAFKREPRPDYRYYEKKIPKLREIPTF